MSNKKLQIPEGGLFGLGNNNDSGSASNEATSGSSKFIIERKGYKEYRVQVAYRLRKDTVDKIQQLARESGRSINDFVQDLFDSVLDNIEIK
jgi:hypothetical protein